MNYTVTGLSVLCLLVAPGFILSRPAPRVWFALAVALAAFLSYLASALVNDVSWLNPGVLSSAAFALYLVGGYVLTGREPDAVVALMAGVALGLVLFYVSIGIDLTRTGSFADLWKYGVAPGVTILVLVLATPRSRHAAVAPVLLVVLAGTSLVLNYRSQAFVALASAAIVTFFARSRGRWPKWQMFGGVGLLGLAFYLAVPVVARTGVLGSALREKIAFTDNGDAGGVPALLAGRTESPLSLSAIADRPLLGWGSAQNISTNTFVEAKNLAVDIGFSPQFPFDLYWYLPNGLVSLHSILLTSWAEGGVLAFALPVLILVTVVRLIWNTGEFGRWSALVTTVSVQAVWDLLFSPWTYNLLPLYACLCLMFASRRPTVSRA
ncbi:O-antigen ligase family protein [Actinomycetes bacterium M1A6_2h]